MRILYVSNVYPPEIAAAAARVSELSQRWVQAGHEVTVLTAYPNHPHGRVPPAYRRNYLWRFGQEWQAGVRVFRTPLLPAANRGTFRRSVAFLSHSASSTAAAPLLSRPDVVIATSPQLLNVLPALAIQWLRRVPFVFEVRDLWPEQMVGVGYGEHSSLVRALRRVVHTAYRRADHVVIVSPAYAPILKRNYDVPETKISHIPNGVDTAQFRPNVIPRRAQFGLSPEAFVVGFVGTIGLSQRFGPVLEAAARLQSRGPAIQLLFVGDGANRHALESEIRQRGLTNVRVFGLQPREQIPEVLATLDAALVLLDDRPYFRVAIPSKMFEIMAMRIPTLLMAEGVAAELLFNAQAGIACHDSESLQAAILSLKDNPDRARVLGANGRRYVEDNYDRNILAEQYLHLLRQITRPQRPRARAATVNGGTDTAKRPTTNGR